MREAAVQIYVNPYDPIDQFEPVKFRFKFREAKFKFKQGPRGGGGQGSARVKFKWQLFVSPGNVIGNKRVSRIDLTASGTERSN